MAFQTPAPQHGNGAPSHFRRPCERISEEKLAMLCALFHTLTPEAKRAFWMLTNYHEKIMWLVNQGRCE